MTARRRGTCGTGALSAWGRTPSRSPLAAGLAVGLAVALAGGTAAAATVERPDCAGMWLGEAVVRVRVDVAAGLFAHTDEPLQVIVPDDARPVLGEGRPRAAVLRCYAGSDTSEPVLQPVPATVAQDPKEAGGAIRVTWAADGTMPSLSLRRYQIYLAPASAPSLGPEEAKAGEPLLRHGENLLPNPSFEVVDAGDASNPAGWYLSGDVGAGGSRVRGVRAEQSARSGRFGFRSWSDGGKGGELGGRAVLSEPVPVTPGTRYHLLVHARILDATGVGLQAVAAFLDAEGKELPIAIRLESEAGKTTNGFQPFRTWMVAPAEARFARLSIGTYKNAGTTDVDDVALFADPAGVEPPPLVLVLPAERSAQYRKSMPPDAGAFARLYDLGPRGSAVAGGFTPVAPEDAFGEGALAGFSAGKPVGRAAPRPDPLAQDHVEMSDATLSLRVPNGQWLVWVLLGDLRSAPAAELGFYRAPVVIKAEGQSRAVVDRQAGLHGTVSLDDDAIALRKLGSDAVWARHVAPRFADAIFAVEVEDGVLDLQCGPRGACPIAAVGVFATPDTGAVQRAVEAYGERRRASFTLAWAVPDLARTQDALFLPSTPERARGFVPFLVDPDQDVYPHTNPTRQSADAAARGVKVRVARGETTAIAVGLWASSFRADVSMKVDQPATPIGDAIGGTPLEARVAAYQAVRLGGGPEDPRFSVRPSWLVGAEKLDLHPGVTRLVWVTVAVPPEAKPGEYDGALLLSAGRERDAGVPITVEVLPITLPASPLVQAAVEAASGEVAAERVLADLAAHGMNAAPLDEPPLVTLDGTKGTVDVGFAALDLLLNQARQAGMDPRATITTRLLQPVFTLLGPNARQEAGFDRVVSEILGQTAAHGGWPAPLHLLDDPSLLRTCADAKAPCAAGAAWRDGRLTPADGPVVLATAPAGDLDPAALRPAKDKRPLWLLDVGGARLGRGLLPWALGAEGVVRTHHLARLGDPLNGWDDDDPMPPHVVAQGDRLVGSLLWERARLGANDARLLALVESQAARAKSTDKALATEAGKLLTELRALGLAKIPATDRRWDGTWAPPEGALAAARTRLVDLAVRLSAVLPE